MAIYQIEEIGLAALGETTFQAEGIFERRDLQALLRDKVEAIGQGLFVLAEEYGNWEESRRRIDLVAEALVLLRIDPSLIRLVGEDLLDPVLGDA